MVNECKRMTHGDTTLEDRILNSVWGVGYSRVFRQDDVANIRQEFMIAEVGWI
jgi:hypothetical protein